MSKYNTGIEFKHDSGLFNHYKKYFDQPTIMIFKAKNSLDSSYKGFIAFKKEIEAFVKKNIKYESDADYYALVDTLRILSEEDSES